MECDFPLFRHRFLSASAWLPVDIRTRHDGSGAERLLHSAGSAHEASGASPPEDSRRDDTAASPLVQFKPLRALDLRSLGVEDGEAGDEAARRAKLASFFKQCSKVLDGLYIGSEYVAKSYETLSANSITHVINCVGALYPEYFVSQGLKYKTLFLRGAPLHKPLLSLRTCALHVSWVLFGVVSSVIVPVRAHLPAPK